METRLVGGSSDLEGRVEVKSNGEWGTVCDDNWDLEDANVVCKSLGHHSAINATKEAYFGEGTRSILLDDLECTGSETNIAYCGHNGYKKHNCEHSEDAGVICEEGALKIFYINIILTSYNRNCLYYLEKKLPYVKKPWFLCFTIA